MAAPPIIPPTQKNETISDQIMVTSSFVMHTSPLVPLPAVASVTTVASSDFSGTSPAYSQLWIHPMMSACGALRTPVLYPCWKADPKAPAAIAKANRMFRPCGENNDSKSLEPPETNSCFLVVPSLQSHSWWIKPEFYCVEYWISLSITCECRVLIEAERYYDLEKTSVCPCLPL